MTTTRYNRTSRFSGKCEACIYPIVRELTDEFRDITHIACPGCGVKVRCERLYGTFADKNCDGSCQSALGPVCSCGCGGDNHQAGYIPLVPTGEVSASVLTAYRRRAANIAAGAVKRSEKLAAKKSEARAREEEIMRDAADKWQIANPDEYAWLLANKDSNDFAESVHKYLANHGTLTYGQHEAVTRNVKRDAAKAVEAALPTKPAPSGTITLTGEIVTVRDEPGFAYNSTVWKMLVRCDGWKAWMSVPASLQDEFIAAHNALHTEAGYTGSRSIDGLKAFLIGSEVTLTADVTPSPDDPSFAFGKRPRKATLGKMR